MCNLCKMVTTKEKKETKGRITIWINKCLKFAQTNDKHKTTDHRPIEPLEYISSKLHLRHNIFKLQKIKYKEKIWIKVRVKQTNKQKYLIYRGICRGITVKISLETMQERKKCGQKSLGFISYIQWTFILRSKGKIKKFSPTKA